MPILASLGIQRAGKELPCHVRYLCYPDLQIIAIAPVKSATCDVLDEHSYMSTKEPDKIANHNDDQPRTGPKIFALRALQTSGTCSFNPRILKLQRPL